MIRILLKNWWVLPIVSIVCSLLIIPLIYHELWGFVLALEILVILLLIIQACFFIFCLVNKNWWKAVGSGAAGIGCFIVFYVATFAVLAFASSQPSPFGKEHPIPEGLECAIPLQHEEINHCDTCELIIWNSFQGGIYEYSFYYPELPDGKIFLRCYEVTENIELSPTRIKTASAVEVKNHDEFSQIANRQQFTIYEGDWFDYYAARIEVWFKNATTKEETKLLEKIYQVEGWSR